LDCIEKAMRLYQAGQSVESVASELQVSASTVRRILNKAGVTMRPRGRRQSL
jgi:orotate phosphoribosyltransferase-like protein